MRKSVQWLECCGPGEPSSQEPQGSVSALRGATKTTQGEPRVLDVGCWPSRPPAFLGTQVSGEVWSDPLVQVNPVYVEHLHTWLTCSQFWPKSPVLPPGSPPPPPRSVPSPSSSKPGLQSRMSWFLCSFSWFILGTPTLHSRGKDNFSVTGARKVGEVCHMLDAQW